MHVMPVIRMRCATLLDNADLGLLKSNEQIPGSIDGRSQD